MLRVGLDTFVGRKALGQERLLRSQPTPVRWREDHPHVLDERWGDPLCAEDRPGVVHLPEE
eukprot:6333389-Alexandrium_andersonii.AAC.1